MKTKRASDPDAVAGGPGEPDWRSAAIESALRRFGEAALRAGASHGLRGDDLDEVLQDVRIRLWHAGDSRAKLQTLTSSYIYRAASSAAVDLLRRRRARREERLDEESPRATSPPATGAADDAAISAETLVAIERALGQLALNRQAVVRMYLQGYDREDIASLLRWSEAKTRNLLYRGLDDLRRRLRAEGVHP